MTSTSGTTHNFWGKLNCGVNFRLRIWTRVMPITNNELLQSTFVPWIQSVCYFAILFVPSARQTSFLYCRLSYFNSCFLLVHFAECRDVFIFDSFGASRFVNQFILSFRNRLSSNIACSFKKVVCINNFYPLHTVFLQ